MEKDFINKLRVEFIESLQDINEHAVLEIISEKVRQSHLVEKQIKEVILNHNEDEPALHHAVNIDLVEKEYGGRYFELMALINMYDPANLIELGTPLTEYDPEIASIIVQINKDMNLSDIYMTLYKVFDSYFSSVSDKTDYKLKHCAVAVFDWLQHQEDWRQYPIKYFISQ